MAKVAFEGVTKRFGEVTAVDHLDLEIHDGEFLVLLGPSGCGKSTALRMVAGLDEPSSGNVIIGDRVINEVPPKDRDVAMVFQTYALYPHLSVEKNIEFPLRSRGVERTERARLVGEVAGTLGLQDLLGRKPAQLSGGQRQRVALARAIVRRPAVFLMDEPLSNLDAALRVQTRADIVHLQRRLGVTTLYVTHDQVEAMTMGHRIAVLEGGRLQQLATPQDLYREPANTFVARFIGSPGMNLMPAQVEAAASGPPDQVSLRVAGGTVHARRPGPEALPRTTAPLTVGVRPEDLRLDGEGPLKAEVTIVELLGGEVHVICRLDDGTTVVVRRSSDLPVPREGESVRLAVEEAKVTLFDADGARVTPTFVP